MPARPCARWCPVGEAGRVGILVVAGCAFVCLLMVVGVALTEVAMQDRRLVACADALAGASVAGAPLSPLYSGQETGINEEVARSRVDVAREELASSTCRVGDGVVVDWVEADRTEVEVAVRARPSVSFVPPALGRVVVPELTRISSARVRGVSDTP